jgi:hypothetical protein
VACEGRGKAATASTDNSRRTRVVTVPSATVDHGVARIN